MLTIREKILQAIESAMQTVVRAGGYNLDIGQSVYRSRRVFSEEELPVVTLIDGPETISLEEYGGDQSAMEVSLQVLLKEINDDTYSKLINSIVGEFRTAIESGDNTWGDLADDTQCTGFTPVYPEEGSTIAAVEINYLITYTTVHGDPYTAFNP